MSIQKGGSAPYAPAATVIQVVDRYRNHGLTTPIDVDVLLRAGVPDSLASRTQQALRTLDLIDPDGMPTAELESLSHATTDEYPKVWAEILRNAYADVFAFVDPAKDSVDRVHDAFRGYLPKGQRARMVTLFLGLCEQAEIIDGTAGRRTPGPKPGRKKATPTPSRAPANSGSHAARQWPAANPPYTLGIPQELVAVLGRLPEPGASWTATDRDTFIRAFTAMLDLIVPIAGTVNEGTRKALSPGSA